MSKGLQLRVNVPGKGPEVRVVLQHTSISAAFSRSSLYKYLARLIYSLKRLSKIDLSLFALDVSQQPVGYQGACPGLREAEETVPLNWQTV